MEQDQFGNAGPGQGSHVARLSEPHFKVAAATFLGGLWLVMLLLHASSADRAVYLLVRNDGSPLKFVAHALTALGSTRLLFILASAAAVLLLWQRRPWASLYLLLITASGKLVADLMKLGTGLPRPDRDLWLVHASKSAFPSGHAANSMIVYLSIALLISRTKTARTWLVAGALLLSALVGISRVELGVHWPSDVVGGWSFGAAWALLCCLAALKLEGRTRLLEA